MLVKVYVLVPRRSSELCRIGMLAKCDGRDGILGRGLDSYLACNMSAA